MVEHGFRDLSRVFPDALALTPPMPAPDAEDDEKDEKDAVSRNTSEPLSEQVGRSMSVEDEADSQGALQRLFSRMAMPSSPENVAIEVSQPVHAVPPPPRALLRSKQRKLINDIFLPAVDGLAKRSGHARQEVNCYICYGLPLAQGSALNSGSRWSPGDGEQLSEVVGVLTEDLRAAGVAVVSGLMGAVDQDATRPMNLRSYVRRAIEAADVVLCVGSSALVEHERIEQSLTHFEVSCIRRRLAASGARPLALVGLLRTGILSTSFPRCLDPLRYFSMIEDVRNMARYERVLSRVVGYLFGWLDKPLFQQLVESLLKRDQLDISMPSTAQRRYTIEIEDDAPIGITVVNTADGRLIVAARVGERAFSLGLRAGHQIVGVGDVELPHATTSAVFAQMLQLSTRPVRLTLIGQRAALVESLDAPNEPDVIMQRVRASVTAFKAHRAHELARPNAAESVRNLLLWLMIELPSEHTDVIDSWLLRLASFDEQLAHDEQRSDEQTIELALPIIEQATQLLHQASLGAVLTPPSETNRAHPNESHWCRLFRTIDNVLVRRAFQAAAAQLQPQATANLLDYEIDRGDLLASGEVRMQEWLRALRGLSSNGASARLNSVLHPLFVRGPHLPTGSYEPLNPFVARQVLQDDRLHFRTGADGKTADDRGGLRLLVRLSDAPFDVCLRVWPEAVGVELGACSLAARLVKLPITPRIAPLNVKLHTKSFLALAVEQHRGALSMELILRSPDAGATLGAIDPLWFASAFFYTLMVSPADGPPSDYLLAPLHAAAELPKRYGIICAKNDRVFSTSRKGGVASKLMDEASSFLGLPTAIPSTTSAVPIGSIRSALFCLDLIDKPIPQSALDAWVLIDPASLVSKWLDEQAQITAQLGKYFSEQEVLQQFHQGSILPMPFPPGLAYRVYSRIRLLQTFLQRRLNQSVRPIDVLRFLDPESAQVYASALQLRTVGERVQYSSARLAPVDLIDQFLRLEGGNEHEHRPWSDNSADGGTPDKRESNRRVRRSVSAEFSQAVTESVVTILDVMHVLQHSTNSAARAKSALLDLIGQWSDVFASCRQISAGSESLVMPSATDACDRVSAVIAAIDFERLQAARSGRWLQAVSKACPPWLHLLNCSRLEPELFSSMLRSTGTRLRSLTLSGTCFVTIDDLPVLTTAAPFLETLVLEHNTSLHNFGHTLSPAAYAAALATVTVPQKTSVVLPCVQHLTIIGSMVESVSILCPELVSFEVVECPILKYVDTGGREYIKRMPCMHLRRFLVPSQCSHALTVGWSQRGAMLGARLPRSGPSQLRRASWIEAFFRSVCPERAYSRWRAHRAKRSATLLFASMAASTLAAL
jgi:hypothetical protein